ncbi:MAG TPA: LLM class flavin-dependent oxidoreductase [Alphaproteobacteria bacterium]|jgi:FMN-dependent oxidoreductase (nitrilotriacetate monooxygenase family)|nr:LLM class flavin-dependent oxidoreductase [Alphaproteobacteria bacterium]
MHLALIMNFSASPHTIGQWRLPRSFRGETYLDASYWERIARTLERGCFDMLFFADSYTLHDRYQDSPDAAIRYAVQYPRLDPLPLIPMLSRVAPNLGFGVTASTTFLPPYWLARNMATIDHLTDGRMGWNVVTSYSRSEAQNFGMDDIPEHDLRYDIADEYMDVCNKLWASWEEDAIIMDREAGIYADPKKVHRINHEGKYFKSRGPLCVPRTPQGRPVIIQAGSSPRGLKFAAQHADVIFAVPNSSGGAAKHRQAINAALAEAGRSRDDVKVIWGITPVVGESEAEVKAKREAILANIHPEAALVLLSGHLNYDLSTWPKDRPLSELEVSGVQAFARAQNYTVEEYARRMAEGSGNLMDGTATQIVDRMEDLYEQTEGDGFMIVTHALPSSVDDFVDLVVPELQRRGHFREKYGARILRDRFFNERPGG